MKRVIPLMLIVALVAALGAPATAKKKKPKPVKMSFYLHGTEMVGEAYLNTDQTYMPMDTKKPAGSEPKSIFVTNYVVGPNTACSGNGLLPTWKGPLIGKVAGKLTVTLQTIATPATKLKVEVFPDGNGGCESTLGNTGYVPPAAAASVDVPPGPGETVVTFDNVKFRTLSHAILQLSIDPSPAPVGPQQVRVLYDSTDYVSKVAFTCTPVRGKKC
jgi:hypothetical protein